MFIPEHSAQQVQAAHNYRLAKSGLPPQKEIIATDAQLDQFQKFSQLLTQITHCQRLVSYQS